MEIQKKNHKFAAFKKTNNTIWELNGAKGVKLRNFRELSKSRVAHFEPLFRELKESHIIEQM
jgi:hypothetical protein